jgi:hypothetical protein
MSVMAILRQLRDRSVVRGVPGLAVLARFPPKVHDGPNFAASDLLGKQQLARRGGGPLKCTG